MVNVNTPGKLSEEELQEPVARLIEEGGADMQTIFQQWVDKGVEKGIEKGIDKGKWDVVMNMLREGASIDFISKVTHFTAHQINEFKEKMRN